MGVKGTCLGNEGRKGGKMLKKSNMKKKKSNMTHKKKMSGVADNSCFVKLCISLDAVPLLGNTYVWV